VARDRLEKYRRIAEEEGAEVVRVLRSKHYKIWCRFDGDRTELVVASFSPSDHRDERNFRAMVRRRARQAERSG